MQVATTWTAQAHAVVERGIETMQFDRTFENVGQMRLGLPPAGFF
jgi:hypothetical protein